MKLRSGLKKIREERALTQTALAARAGLSRQALSALESHAAQPSTAVALRLSRALGCRVEELFWLDEESDELRCALAAPLSQGARPASRLALARIGGRWIAHRLDPASNAWALCTPADAIAERGPRRRADLRVRPIEDLGRLAQNLLIAGCDPALGLLAARLDLALAGARTIWLPCASEAALRALDRGETHLAGAHLQDDQGSGEYNVPFVQRAFAQRAMLLITVAQIEEGIAVAKGNPKRIKRARDLGRRGVRIVNRERGAGARRLLDRELARAAIDPEKLDGYDRLAPGHLEAAQAVALGAADAAITACSAAIVHGLDFLPLASERFDLVLPKEAMSDQRVLRALETLESRAFRRELDALGGYETSQAGRVAAELRVG